MAGNDLVGRGWAYPFRVGGHGGIETVSQEQEIEEAIAIIVATGPGERVMRPTFGCRIHELLFAPLTSETLGLAQRYVEEALAMWEPRIDVEEVLVEIDETERATGRLLITVHYTIRATKDERTLVYPFYLIAREEA